MLPSSCYGDSCHCNRGFCLFQGGDELTACELGPHLLLSSPQCPAEYLAPEGVPGTQGVCGWKHVLREGVEGRGDHLSSCLLMWAVTPNALFSSVPMLYC